LIVELWAYTAASKARKEEAWKSIMGVGIEDGRGKSTWAG
jgi:hypothetical protein